jgi:hypothetical protein
MITFDCAACGRSLKVSDHLGGKKARCPGCRGVVAVPSAPAATPPAQPETVALAAPPGDAATLGAEPVAPGPGAATRHVPGYEILEEVGRGGMGVIYKARQVGLRRTVALKMLLGGEYATAEQRARFRQEAEAVARLQHPGIVAIHEVGEHEGRPYLTLEYVEGGSLARRLVEGPLPAAEAAELLRQLAHAVHFAHKKSVVHRDLKPANVLLAACGLAMEGGAKPQAAFVPKVTDFGLAKQLESASVAPSGPKTLSGSVLGTPAYMAPEQAGGKTKEVGPSADVWALGAIFYECLTGRPPFLAESPLDTLMRVLTEEPTPPRQLDPKIPRDLETVCLKCLNKDPKRRYASAGALAEDLGRFVEGEPVKARPQGGVERLGRWLRRRREVAFLAAGALVVGAVGAVVAGVLQFLPSQPSGVAGDIPGTRPVVAADNPEDEDLLVQARNRMTSSNNLKLIGVAYHNMEAANAELPPPAICSKKDGKPLLSWRVAMLPYLEQENLYRQFKLDEPWDSEHNKKLLPLMPRVYLVPRVGSQEPGMTHYQAFVGPGAAWELKPNPNKYYGAAGASFPASFTDGTSNTIIVAEAATAVPWTAPQDLPFDQGPLLPRLGVFKGGFQVLLGDGSTAFLSQNLSEVTLRAAVTARGGESLPTDWNAPPGTFNFVGRNASGTFGPVNTAPGKATAPAAPPPPEAKKP